MDEDGRGPCIWDEFVLPSKKKFSKKIKSKIKNNDNADIACDHYHRYKEIPAIYITENGASYNDLINSEGKIEDTKRYGV